MAADLTTLAREAADGDQEAFDAIVAATHADVWRLCAYLVDRPAADDLTQETYLRAFRSVKSFRGDSPLRPWLLTIARRVCATEIDARTRRRDLTLKVQPLSIREVDFASTADIGLLVEALPGERRLAFVLTQLIGCDYAEAAEICNCPIGTIRSRVARARDDLIKAMTADADVIASRGSRH
jgi:RNA polymerase sigma-70 factor (ECF subfamily)